MCLTTKTGFKIATHDIVCWKFLEIVKDKNGRELVVTPFAFEPVHPEIFEGKRPFYPKESEAYELQAAVQRFTEPDNKDYCMSVGPGVIHSFGKMSGAYLSAELEDYTSEIGNEEYSMSVDTAEMLGFDTSETLPMIAGCLLYVCVIPEGAKYLQDGDEDYPCYGSDKLIFVRKVAEYHECSTDPEEALRVFEEVEKEIKAKRKHHVSENELSEI